MSKAFYTAEEAAPYCHTSVWTVYRRIREGAIAVVRAGGGRNVLIPVEELRRFLARHGLPIPDELRGTATRSRLLLVDDDEPLMRSLVRYFERRDDYEFRTAISGFAAGMALRAFLPQVIVLDIMLGDMTGQELLKAVRDDPEFAGVRVIAISGYIKDEEIPGLIAAGFDAYLPKPFTLPDLVQAIEQVLRQPPRR